jgi:NCS1 family nucleobase:cation symporter-1
MKRGAVLLSIVAVACNPWRFLTQASIFIQVLSVFSVFATTTSATLNADYWLVRKRAWKVPDLYHEDGIYWYTNGWNLRAVAAWVLGIVPSLRKSFPRYCPPKS